MSDIKFKHFKSKDGCGELLENLVNEWLGNKNLEIVNVQYFTTPAKSYSDYRGEFKCTEYSLTLFYKEIEKP